MAVICRDSSPAARSSKINGPLGKASRGNPCLPPAACQSQLSKNNPGNNLSVLICKVSLRSDLSTKQDGLWPDVRVNGTLVLLGKGFPRVDTGAGGAQEVMGVPLLLSERLSGTRSLSFH